MKETQLQSWGRPHYRTGGGSAFLFYAAFGLFEGRPQLSLRRHRSAGLPKTAKMLKYGDDVHPEKRDAFRSGHLWDSLQNDAPALAAKIGEAADCVVIRAEVDDPPTLDYLRDTVGMLSCLIDHGAIAIVDPQMSRWWSPEAFRERIFDPAAPVPRHHVSILKSPQEDASGSWLHTRGMRKFGRPDVSVHNVTVEQEDSFIELINRLIEHMAFGLVVDEGEPIRHTGLPDGMTCHHGGELDDPEFDNVHIEIRYPR